MFLKRFIAAIKWLFDQIDTILALIIGITCSILGLIGIAQSFIIASATLGVLTILAFALLRDRSQREHMQSSLNQLTTKFDGPDLDSIFSKAADDIPVLVDAENEAWFLQETGTYALETKKALIKSLLRRGGVVRFVVINPREDAIHRLALRNSDFSHEAINGRTNQFRHYIRGFVSDLGEDAEQLQVRFTPYLVDIASIFVDPNSKIHKKRKASILYIGFRVPFEERLGIALKGDSSPKLFSYYFNQVNLLFNYASKIVLLINNSNDGKKSIMANLINNSNTESKACLFFILSRTIWKGNRQVGNEVITSVNLAPRKFATRQNNGHYDIDIDILVNIAKDLEEAHTKNKVIIIDEIGPSQLSCIEFTQTIEKIIDDPSTILFVTIAQESKDDAFIRKLRLHYRSTILNLTSNTKEQFELEKILDYELETAIHMSRFDIH